MDIKKYFLAGIIVVVLITAGACTTQTTDTQTPGSSRQAWAIRYDGPMHLDDFPKGLAADDDGNVYITGISGGGTDTNDDFVTIKYDADGNEI